MNVFRIFSIQTQVLLLLQQVLFLLKQTFDYLLANVFVSESVNIDFRFPSGVEFHNYEATLCCSSYLRHPDS